MRIRSIPTLLLLSSILLWNACQGSGEKTGDPNAWVTVDKKGMIHLFGKQAQDLKDFQVSLFDTLSNMENLPANIPINFDSEVLTDMQGTIKREVDEVLAKAVARKACETTIHGFYRWYDAFLLDESRNIIFTDDNGKHLKLDTAKLDIYLGHFKSSGLVSDQFLANQKNFYKNCETLWQNESKDEVPSCLDGDVCFCAQDWDLVFWTTAPVFIDSFGEQVLATLRGKEYGVPREQNFDMVQENGTWLIAKIHCN